MRQYNKASSNNAVDYSLVEVSKVTTQVVSGTLYKLTVVAGPAQCLSRGLFRSSYISCVHPGFQRHHGVTHRAAGAWCRPCSCWWCHWGRSWSRLGGLWH